MQNSEAKVNCEHISKCKSKRASNLREYYNKTYVFLKSKTLEDFTFISQ